MYVVGCICVKRELDMHVQILNGLRLDTEELAFCRGVDVIYFTISRLQGKVCLQLMWQIVTWILNKQWLCKYWYLCSWETDPPFLTTVSPLKSKVCSQLVCLHGLSRSPGIWVHFPVLFSYQNVFEKRLCSTSHCFSKVGSAVLKTNHAGARQCGCEALQWKFWSWVKMKNMIKGFTSSDNLILPGSLPQCDINMITFTNSQHQIKISVSLWCRLPETYIYNSLEGGGGVESKVYY